MKRSGKDFLSKEFDQVKFLPVESSYEGIKFVPLKDLPKYKERQNLKGSCPICELKKNKEN